MKVRRQRKFNGRYDRSNWFSFRVLLVSVAGCWSLWQFGEHFDIKAKETMFSPLQDAEVIEVERVIEKPVEIQTYKHIDILKIVDAVEQLESSGGKNTNPQALHNICKSKGQENTWGYSGMKGGKCFDTYEQGRAWIAYWWLKKLEANDWNIQKCACIYNLGENRSDCTYAYKLLELIK